MYGNVEITKLNDIKADLTESESGILLVCLFHFKGQ